MGGKYKIVEFKNVGGINAPTKPWPQKFIVSRVLIMRDCYELRPLTFTGFFKAVAQNFITMSLCRFCRLLHKLGFFVVPEGLLMNLSNWRQFWNWKFWTAQYPSIWTKSKWKVTQ